MAAGAKFDFAHFWEDLCYKNGPLITPSVFYDKVGPQYKRITDLLRQHGIKIISLDCDGLIDSLLPTWLENEVNTMFPIEVGTWNASIAPWRKRYGKDLRGVGGMNKNVFARDGAAPSSPQRWEHHPDCDFSSCRSPLFSKAPNFAASREPFFFRPPSAPPRLCVKILLKQRAR